MDRHKKPIFVRLEKLGITTTFDSSLDPLTAGGIQTLEPHYRWSYVPETNVPEILQAATFLTPGQTIHLRHTGRYRCTLCNRSVKKLYSGFCYPCLTQKAQADGCVMSPHRCHYLQGTCREPLWGQGFCYQPHYVYLAFTDKFKVGITRKNQIPTRWCDQGATAAVLLAQTPSRHQAGVLESFLAQTVGDKSHWQKMLIMSNHHPSEDELLTQRSLLLDLLQDRLGELLVPTPPEIAPLPEVVLATQPTVYFIQYPLQAYEISKFTSISLEKHVNLSGVITGIKGQYIFLGSQVFNPRRHEGSMVEIV